jgi:predicted alpha/beta-fold hydrolase
MTIRGETKYDGPRRRYPTMALVHWIDEARMLAFLVIFSVIHFFVHILDGTVIRWSRNASRHTTRRFNVPRKGVFASAAELTRRSQRDAIVEIHVQNPANAHAWFGWPIVVPRSRCDENPLGSPAVAAANLRLRSPVYTNHISTIFANFKPVQHINYRREIVQAADGCDLCVDWALPEENTHLFAGVVEKGLAVLAGVGRSMGKISETFARFGIPPQHDLDNREHVAANHIGVLSILPGLMSLSSTTYIRSFVRVALSHGFIVAMVHTRGLGVPLTRPRMFHGGFTDDVRHWTYNHLTREGLEKRFGTPLNAALVGFSLGANVLGKFLAEDGEQVAERSAVVCASAVSAPWNLTDCKVPMNRYIAKRTYDADFTGSLIQYLVDNKAVLLDPETQKASDFDWERAMKVKDVPEFDKYVVVPHHGFRDADHYYATVSCFPLLHKVRMPLVCVGVADDPICGPPPVADRWQELCARTPYVAYAELPSGGHLGCLGHPLEELTRQPTPIEAIVCRSMAHFLVHRSHGTSIHSPLHSDRH